MLTFLYKLLKSLNSAQRTWQISLSLAFGLLSGLLPLFTPINLLIFFLIFTLNIPIGIYFASLAIFSLIGALIDPILNSVGYIFLTDKTYLDFWTTLYNNPVALWSSFNYTTTLGGFIVGLPLAIFSFFLFNALIPRYRKALERLSLKYKLFHNINPFSQDKIKQRPGVIRWWGSLGFIAVFSGILAFILIAFNPLLKIVLEKSLSFASGKDVVIQEVQSSIRDLRVEVRELKVVDKDRLDYTINSLFFQLDIKHALEKKIDIKEVGFTKLQLNPPQEDVAKIKASASQATSAQALAKKLPKIDFVDVDSVLEKEGVTSLKEFDTIKTSTKEIESRWDEIGKKDLNTQKIDEFVQRFQELKNIKITDANSLQLAIQKAKTLKKDVEEYNQRIKNIEKTFKSDNNKLDSYISLINSLPKDEFQRLKEKYSNLESGGLNFVSTYISPSVSEYLESAIKYYRLLQPYLEKLSYTPEIQRTQGQWIKFTNNNPYPDFMIQRLSGDIISNSITYNILAQDISDNQRVLDKPTIAYITSKTDNFKSLKSSFMYDNREKEPLVVNTTVLKEYKKKSFTNGDNFDIANSLIDFNSKVTLTDFSKLDGEFIAHFTEANMGLKKKSSQILQGIDRVLQRVTSFDIGGNLHNTLSSPKLRVTSDLDEKLSKELQYVIDQETKKFEQELKIKIEKEIKNQLRKANINPDILDEYKEIIGDREKLLAKLETDLKEKYSEEALKQQLEQRAQEELQKQKKKLENDLKEKAKEKLKGILKF